MDIIQIRRDIRKERIERIAQGLTNAIKKFGKELPFNFESIIISALAKFGVTRRVAMEYIDVALFKVELTRSNLSQKKGFFMKFEMPETKEEVSK